MAFLPDPLPPNLVPTRRLFEAADRARGALGEFVGEARLVENSTLITHPLAIREAVLSNKIEGTHTLVADVLLQKAGAIPADPTQRSNQNEVLDYFHALTLGARRVEEGWPVGAPLTRALHGELLAHSADRCRLGAYRSTQAYIGIGHRDLGAALAAARYVPPPPEHLDSAMDNLYATASGPPFLGPLITCALMHYQFEAIHPFEDGNGRLGRLLIPIYLMAQKTLDVPNLYLSAYFAENLDRYVGLMKRVSTHGDWEEWAVFFLDAIATQADESRARTRRIIELHRTYRERVRSSKNRQQAALAAIDLIMERVYVTVRDVAEFAGCTKPTSKLALDSLAELGIISVVPGLYPKTWAAEELLDQVYK